MERLRFWYWLHLKNRVERLKLRFIWALPNWVVYWSLMRVWSNATTGEFSNKHPDEIHFSDAAKLWEKRRGGDRSFR